MPVLFAKVGVIGRILCALFFLCLTFAGITSLLGQLQVVVVALQDTGLSHRVSVGLTLLASAVFGIPAAISLEFLENQDTTWPNGLIVSGLLLSLVGVFYGPLRFIKVLINDFGTDDWRLASWFWMPLIAFIVPLEAITLLAWWMYDSIVADPNWYQFTLRSLPTILIEWLIAAIIVLILNCLLVRFNGALFNKSALQGCDPYKCETYLQNKESDDLESSSIPLTTIVEEKSTRF